MCWLCVCVCARALACVCACVCVWARLRNYLIFNENKEECWNAECYCLPLNLCINNFNIGLPVALFVLINNSCISSNCGFESCRWHGCFFCCECCVLSGKGLYDNLITRPEESYRLWCVVCACVWSRNLKNGLAMVRVGPQRHGEVGLETSPNTYLNWGYRRTLCIWNTYCFSIAIVVTRTHFSFTFVRDLPVLLYFIRLASMWLSRNVCR